jgi:DNA-binding winged helix-turn-helix (wHTH) protein/tetratricopeptide (TPR) repeat protein
VTPTTRNTVGYLLGQFEIRFSDCQLRQGSARISLEPRPFEVLVFLIENRHRVISSEELTREVWGVRALARSAVPTAILAIRRALSDQTTVPQFIQTFPKRGYRFIAPATPIIQRADAETPLVGRTMELGELERALAHVRVGNPQLVLLTGEAGIGKTRLAEEFLAGIEPAEAIVLHGRCREDPGGAPLAPWPEFARMLLDQDTPPRTSTDDRTAASALNLLAEALPESAVYSTTPSLEERAKTFDSISRGLATLSRHRPLVLFLDDLHRSDPGGLHLLQHVVTSTSNARILVVAAYRENALVLEPGLAPLLQQIQARASAHLPLPSLSTAELRVILEEALHTYSVPDADGILERCEGNPLFLIHLARAAALMDRASTTTNPILPAGLRAMIALQLRSLPSTCISALEQAAVAGRRFHLRTVADALGQGVGDLREHLQPALDARLVRPSSVACIEFTHVLVRDALYESLPESRRASMHLALGKALETLPSTEVLDHAAEIAHHFVRASELGEVDRAISFLLLASRVATERFSYEAAAEHLRSAYELLDIAPANQHPRRAEILVALGEAEMRLGSRPEATELLRLGAQLAEQSNNSHLLARAALARSPGFFAIEVGVVDHSLISLLQSALAQLPSTESDARAMLLARQALALSYADDVTRGYALSSEALELAGDASHPRTLAYALSAHHAGAWRPDDPESRLESATRVLEAAIAASDLELALVFRLFRMTDLLQLGRIDAVDRELAAFELLVTELQLPQGLWYVSLLRAMRRHMQGKLDSAQTLCAIYRRDGDAVGDRNAILSGTAMTALLLLEKDRFLEAAPAIDAVREQFPAIDDAWRAASAYGFAKSRALKEARYHLACIQPRTLRRDILWPSAMSCSGIAAALCGDEEKCDEIYGLLSPLSGQNAAVGYSVICLGAIDRALGCMASALGKWDDAEEHFEEALRSNEAQGSPLWHAHTLQDYSRLLAARAKPRDRTRLSFLAEKAMKMGTALGLRNLVRNLKELDSESRGAQAISFALRPYAQT